VTRYVLAGEYADSDVAEDDEWRISRSDFTTLWSLRRSLPATADVGVFGVLETHRGAGPGAG
jgi:hypothetical protein